MEINKTFWAGKKVFITGHTGFKGSWLASWLKLLVGDVTGYALAPNTQPSLFELAEVSKGMTSITGNILDFAHLEQSIKVAQPEIVFHLAAQPLVQYSYQNPLETYNVNVMGTANVLECVRKVSSVRVVVVVTSDKCYENQEWVWGYRETDPMGGFDPYSSSKGCAELVVSAYRRSYFHPDNQNQHGVVIATVRAGNVIGGGDWAEARLVPDLVRCFMQKKVGIIRRPGAYRPWQHVLDLLQGYLLLTEQLWQHGQSYAGAWNFGPSDENIKPVAWIADQLAKLSGKDARWITDEGFNPHEATSLSLDSTKARSRLGWVPKFSIDTILKKTWDWYLAHHLNQDMKAFTAQQILEYDSREATS